MKSVDSVLNQQVSSTGSINAICIPKQGTAGYERVGRRIQMEKLGVELSLIPFGSGTQAILPDACRVLVVKDRSPSGSVPAISDVIQSVDNTGTTATTPWSRKNMNNDARFQLLVDELVSLPGAVGTTGGPPTVYSYDQTQSLTIRKVVHMDDLFAVYKASNGVIADLATNALYVISICSLNASSSTTAFYLQGYVRLLYIDE